MFRISDAGSESLYVTNNYISNDAFVGTTATTCAYTGTDWASSSTNEITTGVVGEYYNDNYRMAKVASTVNELRITANRYETGVSGSTEEAEWYCTTGSGRFTIDNRQNYYVTPKLTHAEKRREKRRIKRYRKAQNRLKRRREAAEKKAELLFADLVGEEAYARFKRLKYHEIIAHSGKRYRLRPGKMIDEMAENFGDKVLHKWCIHHVDYLPQMDTMITQLMLLRSGKDGEDFLVKKARKHAA